MFVKSYAPLANEKDSYRIDVMQDGAYRAVMEHGGLWRHNYPQTKRDVVLREVNKAFRDFFGRSFLRFVRELRPVVYRLFCAAINNLRSVSVYLHLQTHIPVT